MLVDGDRERQLLDLRPVRSVDGVELALSIHGERDLPLAGAGAGEDPPEQLVAADPRLDHAHDLAPLAHRHLELVSEDRPVGRRLVLVASARARRSSATAASRSSTRLRISRCKADASGAGGGAGALGGVAPKLRSA